MVLNWFYRLSVDVSVHHRCWFWQEGELEWDEDDWSRKGKPNRWREGLTAGEKVSGGERQHAQKSLIGRDWSVAVLGVPSNPLRLLLICSFSSWASPRYESEAPACLIFADVFVAPCLWRSFKPPGSITNHKVCFAQPWFFKGSREHSCFTQPLTQQWPHANEAILLIH